MIDRPPQATESPTCPQCIWSVLSGRCAGSDRRLCPFTTLALLRSRAPAWGSLDLKARGRCPCR